MEISFIFCFKKKDEALQYAKDHLHSLVVSADSIPIIYGISIGSAIIETATTINLCVVVFMVRSLTRTADFRPDSVNGSDSVYNRSKVAHPFSNDPIIIGRFSLFSIEHAKKFIRDHAPCNFTHRKGG